MWRVSEAGKNPPPAWGNTQIAPAVQVWNADFPQRDQKQTKGKQGTQNVFGMRGNLGKGCFHDRVILMPFFFFFLLRREQICNALCYLANAEVAVWELSNWAAGMDVHAGFRWCRCSALSFSRTKLQGQNSKLLLTQTRQRSLSHALWPERISHQILLSSLIKLHQVINKKIQPW